MKGLALMAALAGMNGTITIDEGAFVDPQRDMPPVRLSVRKDSAFYSRMCQRLIEVWFDGAKRPDDVVEYDAEAGWIEILLNPRKPSDTLVLFGEVEPRWRAKAAPSAAIVMVFDEETVKAAAEAKRQRKAAKLAARTNIKGGA